jgi:hypothetical protein
MTSNPWIDHVKKFAEKKGIPYFQALKHPDVKKGYKPKTTKGGVINPPPGTFGYKPPGQTPRTPFTFGDTRVPPPPPSGFTMGKKTPSRPTPPPPTRPSPPPPPPPPPSIQMSSLKEFERFLEDKKDAIQQVLRTDYSKKQFVRDFHPDRCFDSNKAIDKLMMKVVGKVVVLNEPFTRQCEVIFKKFSRLYN